MITSTFRHFILTLFSKYLIKNMFMDLYKTWHASTRYL